MPKISETPTNKNSFGIITPLKLRAELSGAVEIFEKWELFDSFALYGSFTYKWYPLLWSVTSYIIWQTIQLFLFEFKSKKYNVKLL